MGKKNNNPEISDEERQVFRDAIKKIHKIKNDKFLLKKEVKIYRDRENNDDNEYGTYLSDNIQKFVQPDEKLFFTRNGVSSKQIRYLKQGRLHIMGTLDLHGFTAEAARKELITFIEEAYRQNRRYLSIIHGKGHTENPVLKNKINHWLQQFDHVLAFCTALPRDGGTGALYVLLKSNRK